MTQPSELDGLRPCPKTPNCVSTFGGRPSQTLPHLTYRISEDALRQALKEVLSRESRAQIVEGELDGYAMRVEFRSPLLRFVDDVEFFMDSRDAQNKILHFRSASRLGYSDLGVNRRRMLRISQALCRYDGIDSSV